MLSYREMVKLNFSLVKHTHNSANSQSLGTSCDTRRRCDGAAAANTMARPSTQPPLMAVGKNQEAHEAAPRAADDYGAHGRNPTPLLSARAWVGNKFNR